MPNPSNVSSPINLYGVGRSGTSLLMDLFARVPWIQNCNETLGLVFGAWSGALFSEFSHDRTGVGVAKRHFAINAVHGALVGAMPTDKAVWAQKLAGIPNNFVWEPYITAQDKATFGDLYSFPFALYKEVIAASFPNAVNVLVVRDPLEVALSRQDFSGWDRSSVLIDVAVAMRTFELIKDRFSFIVHYGALKHRDSAYVQAIFDSLGVPFDERVMAAYDRVHAAGSGKRRRIAGAADYDAYVTELPWSERELVALRSIARSFQALGVPQEYPDYLPH